MKYFKIFFISIFFLYFNSAHSLENKILFKVNNEIITSLDILNEIEYLKFTNKNLSKLNNYEIFEIAKNSKIKEKIKEIEISKRVEKLEVDEKYLNPVIQRIYKNLNLSSLEQFEVFLNKKKIELNDLKKKISIELLWNQLIYAKFSNKVKIDKEIIKEKLLSKQSGKNTLTEYELSEIVFNIERNEKLENKFNKIKNDIEIKKFESAALIHSMSSTANNSGYLGWIKETSLNKNIRDKLTNLNKGDFTDPIVVPGGFLILKINNLKKIDKILDIDKETSLVVKEKTNEQLNQFSNMYFNIVKKNIEIYEL